MVKICQNIGECAKFCGNGCQRVTGLHHITENGGGRCASRRNCFCGSNNGIGRCIGCGDGCRRRNGRRRSYHCGFQYYRGGVLRCGFFFHPIAFCFIRNRLVFGAHIRGKRRCHSPRRQRCGAAGRNHNKRTPRTERQQCQRQTYNTQFLPYRVPFHCFRFFCFSKIFCSADKVAPLPF